MRDRVCEKHSEQRHIHSRFFFFLFAYPRVKAEPLPLQHHVPQLFKPASQTMLLIIFFKNVAYYIISIS